jgi:Ni,Fe-hydrogenase I cytochrome b subunit
MNLFQRHFRIPNWVMQLLLYIVICTGFFVANYFADDFWACEVALVPAAALLYVVCGQAIGTNNNFTYTHD